MNQKSATFFERILPVLKQRCPRCLQGEVFTGLLNMHQTCSVCDLEYEREPGYFTGAMYISYGLAVFSVLPVAIIMFLLSLPSTVIFWTVGIQLVLTSPLLFRYSRVLWLHLDQMISPR